VWGELSIIGNELRITIPESFLSEAAYPVVVDPAIGTTTVGSQYLHIPLCNEDMETENIEDYEYEELYFADHLVTNRYAVWSGVSGTCTAYLYAAAYPGYLNTFFERYENAYPVLYSDNGEKPQYRRCTALNHIDCRVTGQQGAGWRSGTFRIDGTVTGGSYIWFGASTGNWCSRFDYGAALYSAWWGMFDPDGAGNIVPDTFPLGEAVTYDRKVSMYFSYTEAQTYVRTITQGVTLTDTRKQTGNYKRSAVQEVTGTTGLTRLAAFPRLCVMTVHTVTAVKALPAFIRFVIEQVRALTETNKSRGLARHCMETIRAGSETKRSQGYYRRAYEDVRGTDTTAFPVLFLRSPAERVRLGDTKTHWGEYIRGLQTEATGRAETTHRGEYYRKQTETVQAEGIPFRSLLLFVRLFTTAFVRDFLLRRFLKSNEELVLKSPVCREMSVESRI
jgi:hypothetical protein